MPVRHLLSVLDLSPEDIVWLTDRSVDLAMSAAEGQKPLAGKIVGIYFRKPSTRTRNSFTVGALKLGAQAITFGPNDFQITTGETIGDTVRVLSGYLDAFVIRTNEDVAEMKVWGNQDRVAIINAMSESEHPTQAIADLSAIKEAFGRLEGIDLLYIGEGNNTAASLTLAVAQTPGMKITLVTPAGYGLGDAILGQAHQLADRSGAVIEHHHRVDRLPKNVDVVYTTRWQTMGVPHQDPSWRDKFRPYAVTSAIMSEVSKKSGTIFLHDLPAVRGEDVSAEVLDGPQSWAWRQAVHKMYSAMAVLQWCMQPSSLAMPCEAHPALRVQAVGDR
jgi:ornithine carbamoyltransferase